MSELLEKLIKFKDSMAFDDDKDMYVVDPWYYTIGVPFNDFNFEIIAPSAIEKFPQGGTGIRVDDDFWIVGVLPYEFRTIPLVDIVKLFWPQYMDTATYNATTLMMDDEEEN